LLPPRQLRGPLSLASIRELLAVPGLVPVVLAQRDATAPPRHRRLRGDRPQTPVTITPTHWPAPCGARPDMCATTSSETSWTASGPSARRSPLLSNTRNCQTAPPSEIQTETGTPSSSAGMTTSSILAAPDDHQEAHHTARDEHPADDGHPVGLTAQASPSRSCGPPGRRTSPRTPRR